MLDGLDKVAIFVVIDTLEEVSEWLHAVVIQLEFTNQSRCFKTLTFTHQYDTKQEHCLAEVGLESKRFLKQLLSFLAIAFYKVGIEPN